MNTSVESGFSVPRTESLLVTFVKKKLLFMKIIVSVKERISKMKSCTGVTYMKEGDAFVLIP